MNKDISRDINVLPPEAQRQLEDFIIFLRWRYQPSLLTKTADTSDLATEEFVDMWRDREDMRDSTAWIRKVRQSHWSK